MLYLLPPSSLNHKSDSRYASLIHISKCLNILQQIIIYNVHIRFKFTTSTVLILIIVLIVDNDNKVKAKQIFQFFHYRKCFIFSRLLHVFSISWTKTWQNWNFDPKFILYTTFFPSYVIYKLVNKAAIFW